MGWILETNKPMNRAMEGMGGKIVKRYRVYERGPSARIAESTRALRGPRGRKAGPAAAGAPEPRAIERAPVEPCRCPPPVAAATGGFLVGVAALGWCGCCGGLGGGRSGRSGSAASAAR